MGTLLVFLFVLSIISKELFLLRINFNLDVIIIILIIIIAIVIFLSTFVGIALFLKVCLIFQ